jgi:hypothetical protein
VRVALNAASGGGALLPLLAVPVEVHVRQRLTEIHRRPNSNRFHKKGSFFLVPTASVWDPDPKLFAGFGKNHSGSGMNFEKNLFHNIQNLSTKYSTKYTI